MDQGPFLSGPFYDAPLHGSFSRMERAEHSAAHDGDLASLVSKVDAGATRIEPGAADHDEHHADFFRLYLLQHAFRPYALLDPAKRFFDRPANFH